jgi:5'-nucleotidase
MGEDVLYSGTVSVAMEAVTLGVPGIAFSSSASHDIEMLKSQVPWVTRLIKSVTSRTDFPKATVLNINLPNVPGSDIKGIKVTQLGSRYFSDSLARMQDPWGRPLYWIGGGTITWTGSEMSDHQAVADGYISVTPLHMDLTNYKLLDTVRGWQLDR